MQITELNEQEHEEYTNDISKVVTDLVGKVISTADKHNVDRDNAMRHFAVLLSSMIEISTFENWNEK